MKGPLAGKPLQARVGRVAIVTMGDLPETLPEPELVADQSPVPAPEEHAVDIHKPKPVHNWREFLSEISVIVCGIAIALTGEQVVEQIHWSHKIETVQRVLERQMIKDAQYAFNLRAKKSCADPIMKLTEQSLLNDRPDLMTAIYTRDRDGNPFDPQPWQASAWDTAQSGDVVSHLDQDRSEQYARLFRLVTTERELQWELQDEYADLMSTRFGSDANSRPGQLATLERYRQTGLTADDIANSYLRDAAKLGARPTAEAIHGAEQSANQCMTRIRSAQALGVDTRH